MPLRVLLGVSMPENTPVFYIVQLLPVDAPQLVKLGHTHNMAQRLAFMRTTCPPASLVKMWQCLARQGIRLATRAEAPRGRSPAEGRGACIGPRAMQSLFQARGWAPRLTP